MSTILLPDIVDILFGVVTLQNKLHWLDGIELKDILPSPKKSHQAFGSVDSPLLGTSSTLVAVQIPKDAIQSAWMVFNLFSVSTAFQFYTNCNRFLPALDHPR